ncbi:MAG: hypothetical protein WCG45_01995 [bacterium]
MLIFNLEKIKDYATRIISGSEHLERLSPGEEQGRIRGGRRNGETPSVHGTNERTDSEATK